MTPSIIKHDRVRIDDGGAPPAGPPGQAAALARPRTPKGVRLLERDGRVHAIELVCTCGEVSVIELDYGDAPAAQRQAGPHRAEETR
jgi:hypothetical protein